MAALRGHKRTADALWCAYQVASYARIRRGIEPADRHQLSDCLRGYWRELDDIVP